MPGRLRKAQGLVEMFKAHLVMIQRKSAKPYARETEKGPRPGDAVKAPAFSSQALALVRSSNTLALGLEYSARSAERALPVVTTTTNTTTSDHLPVPVVVISLAVVSSWLWL